MYRSFVAEHFTALLWPRLRLTLILQLLRLEVVALAKQFPIAAAK